MNGGSSIVLTRKVLVDVLSKFHQIYVNRSLDASQLYPFSMCQDTPAGLYTRWEFDTDVQKS